MQIDPIPLLERRTSLKRYKTLLILIGALGLLVLGEQKVRSQEKASQSTVQVHVVITDEALQTDKELPPLKPEDVKVKQGKNFLKVTHLIPAEGTNAALQLMILIDDTLNTSVGNNLEDLKKFIGAQPPSTVIAVGYMSNAGVNVVQNFTPDHDLAVKAVRLPRGSPSTMDSPYLSLISLVKGWPQQKVRREVLMVTDGIDRLRGERPEPRRLGPDYGVVYHRPEFSQGYQSTKYGYGSPRSNYSSDYARPGSNSFNTMPTISVDAPSASEVSQRYSVLVYSLYAAGVGQAARSGWEMELGLGGLSQIADETGGECFSLGTSQLVSFQPYLDNLQNMLSQQYYVVFEAVPKKKAGFQRIKIQTELSNSELEAPDNVWVPAAGK
jgi:hypothetical protein